MNDFSLSAMTRLKGMNTVQPRAAWVFPLGIAIREGRSVTCGIPFLAVNNASMTADTDIQINNKAKLNIR